MKKLLAFLLTITMMLSLGTTAFAEGNGSITIKPAVDGKTYTIYRIFDLSFNEKNKAYTYTVNDSWKDFINQSDIKGSYVTLDDQGYVTSVDESKIAEFAKLALKYAKDNGIANQGMQTANSGTVQFTGLELGYYLVDSSLGALCALTTTDSEAEIKEKNGEPTVDKEVKEDSTGSYGDHNDADIGDVVEFRTTITAQPGAENYVLHDKMSDGLTFNEVISVTLNGTAVDSSNYTVTSSELTDGCTFEISFTKDFCDDLVENDKIVVSYTAILNENAVIAGEGNPNETWLSYGDDNQTTKDNTTTKTWKVEVFKYTEGENDTENPLAGATFTLSRNADGSAPINLVETSAKNTYKVCTVENCNEHTSHVTEITTDETGRFTIVGLDSDTYYLTETKAPEGYNKLSSPIAVVIDKDGNVKINETIVQVVEVLNKTGSELPETGGIGTTIFYVVGGVLMLGAAIMLITKKKMSASKK